MDNEIYDDLDELPAPPRDDIPEADLVLLERAARVEVIDDEGSVNLHFAEGSVVHSWNPLMFSGDVFDLAATLELDVMHRVVSGKRVEVMPAGGTLTKHFYEGDCVAATTRAVVLSAAQIVERRHTPAKSRLF